MGNQVVVDKISALSRLGNDEDLFKEMLELFLSNLPTQLKSLSEAISIEDYSTIKKIIHTLKSSSNIIGATSVANLLEKMQQNSSPQSKELLKTLFLELSQCIKETIQLLK